MNNNLDILAIQTKKEELLAALNKIETDNGDLILFNNLECDFFLGGQTIRRSFDTAIYYDSQNGNNYLILLMKDGIVTPDEIRQYLEERSLKYHEVSFVKGLKSKMLDELNVDYPEEKQDKTIPEMWFAQEESKLKTALNDSIVRGHTTCDYYPMVEGIISFTYTSDYNRRPKRYGVDRLLISGVIAFEDKMILMINNGNDQRNLDPQQVQAVLEELGVAANICINKKLRDIKPNSGKSREKKYG